MHPEEHYGTVGHFAKIRLILRAKFASLEKWKMSKNGSKMGQKGLTRPKKVSEKYTTITKLLKMVQILP